MKKKVLLMAITTLILSLSLCSCMKAANISEEMLEPYVGEWLGWKCYQGGVLLNDDDSSFHITINEDASWKIVDDTGHTGGSGELKYDGESVYLDYGDDYRYFLSIEEGNLVVLARCTVEEVPDTTFIFKKVTEKQ